MGHGSTAHGRFKSLVLCAGLLACWGVPGLLAQEPSRRGLTLDQVVHAALEQSPLVAASEARVRSARGARLTARSLPNPVLTYQVENAAFPGQNAPAGLTRETSLFATLPLEPLWQRWPRLRSAGEDLRAAEADLTLARRAVALDAARAFFRVALAQIAVRAAADIEAGLDSLVRFNRARVGEGVAAEGDLIRIEVELDRASTDRALQEVELVRARSTLAPFLGDADRMVALTASLAVAADDSAPAALAEGLRPADEFISRALALRPDLAAARARARSAGAEVAFQRTLVLRQVGAFFGARSTGGVRSMIAGLSLPVPLFDQNRGEVQRATGERIATEREVAWAERLVVAEVAGAYEAARVLTAQAGRLQRGFLSRAEEARRIAVTAYQEGAAPLLQVIDATRTLADSRLTYYRALFARQESLLDLYAAAGLDPVAAAAASAAPGAPSSPAALPMEARP